MPITSSALYIFVCTDKHIALYWSLLYGLVSEQEMMELSGPGFSNEAVFSSMVVKQRSKPTDQASLTAVLPTIVRAWEKFI